MSCANSFKGINFDAFQLNETVAKKLCKKGRNKDKPVTRSTGFFDVTASKEFWDYIQKEFRCPDHPKYRVIRKPRTLCEKCWELWIDKKHSQYSLEGPIHDYMKRQMCADCGVNPPEEDDVCCSSCITKAVVNRLQKEKENVK